MLEGAMVYGTVVVVWAGLVTAAFEGESWKTRLRRFLLAVCVLVALTASGAWMGIVFREALKALP